MGGGQVGRWAASSKTPAHVEKALFGLLLDDIDGACIVPSASL